MKISTKRILWLTPLGIAAAYVVALVGLRSEPSGYVASYSVFPHATTDIFDFSHGTVTLRTCCGNSSWGTYSRSSDGAWIWHLRYGTRRRTTREIRVQSGFFSMTFTVIEDPSVKFTLRRRVFANYPL